MRVTQPERSGGAETGAVLAMVIIVAAVMMLLVLAAFMMFRANVNSAVFQRDRIMAAYAAESGANLALHFLAAMEDPPMETINPFPEGITMPEGSRAMVLIEPAGNTDPLTGNGSAEIRSLGEYRSQQYRLIVRAVPRYLSGFALVSGGDIPAGFFTDNRRVDGPVHANGSIYFDSTSPDSTNDPWVAAVTTTPQGGFVFSDAGYSDVPHPDGSRTWVRPWTRHIQGRPYWYNAQEPVDMTAASADFSALASRSVSINAERMLLDGDRIIYRRSLSAPAETLFVREVSTLSVFGGPGGTMIKSRSALNSPLTIISRGNIVIGGPIDGGLAGHGGPLGIAALGDIIVETDPSFTGGHDWERPWNIETASPFVIRAFLAAPNGRFRSRNIMYPPVPTQISVHGGIAVNSFTWSAQHSYGHKLGIAWDPGLVSSHPPGFPQVWKWAPVSWLMNASEEAFRNGPYML